MSTTHAENRMGEQPEFRKGKWKLDFIPKCLWTHKPSEQSEKMWMLQAIIKLFWTDWSYWIQQSKVSWNQDSPILNISDVVNYISRQFCININTVDLTPPTFNNPPPFRASSLFHFQHLSSFWPNNRATIKKTKLLPHFKLEWSVIACTYG